MNPVLITGAAILTLAALLAVVHVPLGTWIHRVFTDEQDWRVERAVYRVVGVDPRTEQRWTGYATSVVSFAVVSVLALFLLIMVQGWLPWSQGRSMTWHTALNTAVSFVTNTNWQSYAGEAGAGYTVQAVGLTVQNFVSAATGLAVAVALLRGIARHSTDRIGNFWVDLVRGTTRVLLPLAAVAAVVLLLGGVIQNLADPQTITTVTGGQQVIQGGPVASQEAIKELGTNGGGFFNANSAHPFENPNAWTNLFEIFLLLVIPFSLPYTFGLMVRNRRQGFVATATMAGLLVTSTGLAAWAEYAAASGPLGSAASQARGRPLPADPHPHRTRHRLPTRGVTSVPSMSTVHKPRQRPVVCHGERPDPRSRRACPTHLPPMTEPLEELLEERAAENLEDAPRRDIVAAIAEMVAHPEYPCLGARSVFRRDAATLLVLDDLADTSEGGSLDALGAALTQYADEVDVEGDLVSFVACFRGPVPDEEREFEALLWGALQHLHDNDDEPWADGVAADPDNPHFAFSLAGTAFFVVGLHPSASRIARRAPLPTLVFNLHDQFERLRGDGRYQRMRDTIRRRDTDLQGFPNPMVSDHGEDSEARQYAGRAVPDSWSAPFEPDADEGER